MEAERWRQIDELLEAALEIDAGRRGAFLREACAGDEGLFREVEELVKAHAQASDFIEAPALQVAAELLADTATESMIGKRVDRYEILSLLGAGGMGEVYLAEDTTLHRKVAIKLLPAEFTANADRLHRFECEAFAASSLNHPNILTIHEIGAENGHHFIATEFIDGESLRQHLNRAQLELHEVLEIGMQVASALAAAHAAGIVHRDIKPENIMVRKDGIIKVLDFGLAKLVQQAPKQSAPNKEAPTKDLHRTAPGLVMGTASYMSPEQARGKETDGRTDIWSLGVMLYEMVTDRLPFAGETTTDTLGLILHKEPEPLTHSGAPIPVEMDRIVTKALRKDREERYQVVKDLGLDLKSLERQMEFEAEFERGAHERMGTPERSRHARGAATGEGGAPAAGTAKIAATSTGQTDGGDIHTRSGSPSRVAPFGSQSSAEYIVTEIKQHKRGLLVTLSALVIAAAALSYFFFKHQPATLTNMDTILLADFENTTGDAVFDGTLKQGLAVTLGQSPFLSIFPEERVQETLRLMERPPEERVTEPMAREICQRQGLKAFLVGSIASLGSHYVITLKAVNAQMGDVMAREQTESQSKEQVLTALSQAASKLREKLGESLSSIQKFDAPLEQATTSSLDALEAYSLGLEQADSGNYSKAIPFYQHAVELDPDFALGYLALAREQLNNGYVTEAAASASKAFELRERATENEKLFISLLYHEIVRRDLEKAIEVGEVWKQTYPRYWRPFHALADLYYDVGQFEKAAAAGHEAVRLNPKVAAAYSNYAGALFCLNRFAEAKEIYQQAMANGLDAPEYHAYLYQIAYISGDTEEMKRQLNSLEASPSLFSQYMLLVLQAYQAARDGRWRQSQDISRRIIELVRRGGMKGPIAETAGRQALTGAMFGDCQTARRGATQSPTTVQDIIYPGRAVALGVCGEVNQAQLLADRLAQLYPNDTKLNGLWLPVIRAAIEIKRNNPALAIQFLETARRYEAAAEFQPQYLRGLAYLKLNKGAEAAAEFQKILDHQGEEPLSALYPLARLGLARAYAASGEEALSRQTYRDFFAVWQEADSDLPILLEAKKEYEKLDKLYQQNKS